MSSLAVLAAIEREAQLRAEFADVRLAAYLAAQEATRGAMLNPRGLRAGIDAWSLFTCNETMASAYASAELVEWWTKHPRMTFRSYERQMIEGDI